MIAGRATYALRWGRFVKRVRVLVANHPRLMRELVMATIADQPDIEVVGEVQNESDLADYWDILLISKRTEAVGRLIYYPFVILSLLIVARLRCFDNWTWSPVVIVVLSMHFSLALYAAWLLPKVARVYRDKVLERLKRRRRQALMLAQRTPEAIDTMIEEVQSTHQGAFSYLWEQPAIRALLLPSSGIGLATLLQFLPH